MGGRGRDKEWGEGEDQAMGNGQEMGKGQGMGKGQEMGEEQGRGGTRDGERPRVKGDGQGKGGGIKKGEGGTRKGIGSSGGCLSPCEGGGAGHVHHHACGHSRTVVGWALVVEQGALVIMRVGTCG